MHEPSLIRGSGSPTHTGGGGMSAAPPRTSVPLIDSINKLPYHRVQEDQSYVVSGTAMNEILDELRKLWTIRESLAELIQSAKKPAD